MDYLHRITHSNELIQKKVNFFADYFIFAIKNVGVFEDINIENQLSLVEKIIFQIDNNLKKSIPYINNYILNPLLSDKFICEFESYKDLQPYIQTYSSMQDNKKLKWIEETPEFRRKIILVKEELESLMFKKALEPIISFLQCPHEINEHKNDIIYFTNIIISELFLTGRREDYLSRVFERIITDKIELFPFPEEVKERAHKEEYIKHRSFDQQFEGLYNILKEPKKQKTFFFRIFGLKVNDHFKFTYNNVNFLSPNLSIFKSIKKKNKGRFFCEKFFSEDDYVIASATIDFHSNFLAKQEVINRIREGLVFLNLTLQANGALDIFTYLSTSDFKTIGWAFDNKSKSLNIDNHIIPLLKDNPFHFLRRKDSSTKKHILSCELIFINASVTNRISDYWHYLEVLLPKSATDVNVIKKLVSHILLINLSRFHHSILKNYISNSITPFAVSAERLGITIDQQEYFYKKVKPSFKELKKQIKHPFVNYLIERSKGLQVKNRLEKAQLHYYSVLTEAYEQRNTFIHKGIENEKSVIKISYTLPRLIQRLRWIIFDEILENEYHSFEDLVDKLNLKGKQMLL